MAHVAKYQAGALGNMCAHYDRWGGDLEKAKEKERGNIDISLTHLNYNLAPEREGGQVAFINRRIASLNLKRAPRKDAVRMEDCVLTQPQSLDPERSREFFEAAYSFLAGRYGAENVVSAYVHMDEPKARPHMHFAWVPVTRDGRLAAKDVTTRADLRTLHGDLKSHLEEALGCEVEVLLSQEKQGEKQLSSLNQQEYIAAKDEIAATKTRLEHLQRQVAEVEPVATTLTESVRTLIETRGDAKRERSIEAENQQLRGRVEGLERDCSEARGRIRQLEEAIPRLREQLLGARGRLEELVTSVSQRLRERGIIPDSFSRSTQEIARKIGVRVLGRFDYDMEQARAAARAYNSTRGHRPPSRSNRHER